jgi:hypothetical protein
MVPEVLMEFMRGTIWLTETRRRIFGTALTCTALFCSCGREPAIKIPVVEGFEAPADDPDLLPVYDRAYFERTLPDDGRCRLRYTADYDYDVYSGNRAISERTSPTYLYAAQEATRFASLGRCRKEAETCAIVPLRRGYSITINGDRLNAQAVESWEELARNVNYLYRHQLCTPI